MTLRDHRAYVRFYFEHPEAFEDRPPLGISGALWIRKIQEGKATLEDADRVAQHLREQWESYHQVKADSLGFDIDPDRLESDLTWLALEFRLAAEET